MNVATELYSWGWIGAIATIFSTVSGYNRLRQGQVQLSQRRTKRLYILAQAGKWHKADPAALQIAVADALRFTFDDRYISFAMERHSTLKLLSDLKMAMGLIKLSRDKRSIVDSKEGRWLSFRQWAVTVYFCGLFPWVVLCATLIFKAPLTPKMGMGIGILATFSAPFGAWAAACMEAAHRLTTQLDERYPLLRPHKKARAVTQKPKQLSESKEFASIPVLNVRRLPERASGIRTGRPDSRRSSATPPKGSAD